MNYYPNVFNHALANMFLNGAGFFSEEERILDRDSKARLNRIKEHFASVLRAADFFTSGNTGLSQTDFDNFFRLREISRISDEDLEVRLSSSIRTIDKVLDGNEIDDYESQERLLFDLGKDYLNSPSSYRCH